MIPKSSVIHSFVLIRIIGIACFVTLWLTGCSIYNLREEVKTINNSTILVGTVTESFPSGDAPILVVTYSKIGSHRNIEHYTKLHEAGPYELIVPKGEYFIFAFVDINHDSIYQHGEPSGQYSAQGLLVEQSGGVLINLDISIKNQEDGNVDFPTGTLVATKKSDTLHSTSPGAIADLNAPLFDYENGAKGYWQPLEFFKENGGNIYFLQPFDPTKIPVLYVHGATGSPRGWEYLVSNIDQNRYQPWFYYYPSGASLKSMADLLFWKMYNLKAKYKFKELYIVAHSMGGLVVRSFLVDYGQQFPEIKKFISISTPWGGDSLSEMGVKYSPGVIPAWKDLGQQSEFVQSIYRKTLPDTLEFYLLFGHEGNHNPLRPNTDGVVTLASELDPRVQAEAKMIYGFNEDHNNILTSGRVASIVNTILAPGEKTKTLGSIKPGGMLMVSLHLSSNQEGQVGSLQLYLSPIGREPADGIIINMGSDRGAHVFGPFPPGIYNISLLAESFRTEPARLKVAIRSNGTVATTFELKPNGSIVDFIRQKFYKDENPAGTYMLPEENITIRSIRLTGNGVDRTLVPTKENELKFVENALDRRDWATKTLFAFYNLPEGEYRLIVEADGYENKVVQRQVTPGHLNVFNGIVMKPLK
ncbi:alpha/beta hydrolase [Desulfopila sp. IMCC35006]|uniref:alpha/beta hydrolase n=1 Tax=Desulfopila sp. IMCC35006 TaxID=2569542 RepID=UPI0010AB9A95|nr:alpha/beta hydrolase [Desulfopila sp. IMCC35006]TKB25467.1 alpha/beta hydrolase [Desulfopila sp. IMCC35006]